jgi:probable phosphoglycerate mutase
VLRRLAEEARLTKRVPTQATIDRLLNEEIYFPFANASSFDGMQRSARRVIDQYLRLYASDLQRAWRTAELALTAQAIEVLPAPTLRERHYGVFQGRTVAEMRIEHPEAYAHYVAREPGYDFETGESLTAFAQRVLSGLAALAREHQGGTVLAFTHGGVLDVLYRLATGQAVESPRSWQLGNATINRLLWTPEGLSLVGWSDASHLESEPPLDESSD